MQLSLWINGINLQQHYVINRVWHCLGNSNTITLRQNYVLNCSRIWKVIIYGASVIIVAKFCFSHGIHQNFWFGNVLLFQGFRCQQNNPQQEGMTLEMIRCWGGGELNLVKVEEITFFCRKRHFSAGGGLRIIKSSIFLDEHCLLKKITYTHKIVVELIFRNVTYSSNF